MKSVITFLKKAWYHTWKATKKTATFIRVSWYKYRIGKILWTLLKGTAMVFVVGIVIVVVVMKWLLTGGGKDN